MGRVAVGVTHGLPQPERLRRLDAGSAQPFDQQPAREERLVAKRLGVEPEPRPPRQEPVGRVLARASGVTRDDCR